MKGLQIAIYVIDRCHPKLLLVNASATTFWQFATSQDCVYIHPRQENVFKITPRLC